MFIDGIGISNFRSFGNTHQKVGPFGKINLFIGQNNSGKSNILLFLMRHYKSSCKAAENGNSETSFEEIDRPKNGNSQATISFGLSIGGNKYKNISDPINPQVIPLLERLLRSEAFLHDGIISWFTYRENGKNLVLSDELLDKLRRTPKILDNHEWSKLWQGIFPNRTHFADNNQHITDVLAKLTPVNLPVPKIHFIPAIRQVGAFEKERTGDDDNSGRNLIQRLAQMQHPPHNRQELKARFAKIINFLRIVTGDDKAVIEIPDDKETIHVIMGDQKVLPLSSLGTGIQEVLILASVATVVENEILCIEEPEIHLHPTLQKKLIQYLSDSTNNQYFITTHSVHLLDASDVSVFHVSYDGNETKVDAVHTPEDKSQICFDLGYRPSDLMQANCIIWVEGPSDRIYLNHWIKSIDDKLVEGINYSIMFYGGRLLSHLTATDLEVDEFISLRKINRYIAIIIDSDKKNKNGKINETKHRIVDEFNSGPGFAWVTKGREIENYISKSILQNAIKQVHPSVVSFTDKDGDELFDDALLSYNKKQEKIEYIDKVKVANQVVQVNADLTLYDLNSQIKKLIDFIRKANLK